MNMVGFDAIIATHDAKYTYWSIRPSQADPGIKLSIGLPNFPSYPSNHASLSGGMAKILGSFFPAERQRLDGLADQAAMSRLYGGIHFRNDNDTGLRLGRTVAQWALCHDRSDEREDRSERRAVASGVTTAAARIMTRTTGTRVSDGSPWGRACTSPPRGVTALSVRVAPARIPR